MAVQTKIGDFQLNDSTGNQSVTGIGFQPVALILFVTPDTVNITNQTANFNFMIGFATASDDQRAMSLSSQNGTANSSVTKVQNSSHCIDVYDGATRSYSAALVSMDSDGFTINIDDAPADVYRVGYLALAGDGVSAATGQLVAKTGTTGVQAYTGVGFQPSTLIFTSVSNISTPSSATHNDTNNGFSFGFTDGTSGGAATTFAEGSAGVSNTLKFWSRSRCITTLESTPDVDYSAAISSLDEDGFTLNWVDVGSAGYVFYLALAGVDAKVGYFALNTSTGSQSISGVGFKPGAVLFAANNVDTHLASEDDGAIFAGMATADDQYTIGGTDEDAVTTMNTDHHSRDDYSIRMFTTDNNESEAFSLESMDSDGFTINLSAVLESSPSQVNYMAFESVFDSGEGNTGTSNASPSILSKFIGI